MYKPLFYDKKGNGINIKEYHRLFSDLTYQIIKQEYTPLKKYWISTVWLGMDMNMVNLGKPVIFESMVFPHKGCDTIYLEEDCERYTTEEEALKGHQELVTLWTEKEANGIN